MAIARHPVLSKAALAPLLPPLWSALYEIAQMDAEIVKAKIEDGTITPTISKKAAASVRKGIIHSEPVDQGNIDAIIKAESRR